MKNYELKEWTKKGNKTVIILRDENMEEKEIKINNTFENIILQVEKLMENKDGRCKFANGLINIDIIKETEGEYKLIEDAVNKKEEYMLTKIASL